jgi:ribosomal protein S12 methylthiotransferase accessory factor
MSVQLKRIKPYKARLPEETVTAIKSILEDIGLQFEEQMVEGNNLFKALSLSIINPDTGQIIFSTYGKGVSLEWASASAWGEMAERIQNLAFFMTCIYPTQPENIQVNNTGFKYFPDEKLFSFDIGADPAFLRYFEQLTGIKAIENRRFKNILGVPFYNIFDRKTEYLPFRALQVIVGSNGMCSGNTREEALIQGISEIFERFVLKAIYLNPFCPPDIPLSYFQDSEIWFKINDLVRLYHYEVQIKDCSMGKGYPVIGALIKDRRNRYLFHLGADPSPVTALERCFTEMFQGGNICFQSIAESKKNLPYDLASGYWKKNMSFTIKAYAGQWPAAVLSDTPDYEFTGFGHPESVSDQDDLNYLLRILKNENRKIFVRDNTFLGQPAYYVYVPGMSEMTGQPDSTFAGVCIEFDKYLHVITNLKKSTKLERTEMKNLLQIFIDASPGNQFNPIDYFKFNPSHPIARLSSDQFLALIDFSLCDGKILDHFSIHKIKSNSFLNSVYASDSTFKPSEIFNFTNIPACFECETCNFKNKCNLPYLESIWEKMKKIMYLKLNEQVNSFVFDDV